MGAGSTAKLLASLALDSKDFTRGIDKAMGSLGKMESRLGKIGSIATKGIGTAANNIAKIGVGVAVAAGGLLAKSIQEASNLGETISKVGVVFGAQSKRVLAFGEDSATALGLSKNAALGAAATYGNLFVSMGLTEDKSADMSLNLVKLAADLASFNNIDPTEALDKLRAGLTGESEPLKTLGININETLIKQKAFDLGLTKTTKGTLPAAIKAQAAYALIFEQSATAQGDFARTSEGLANQTRILKANLANAGATIGTAVLPQVAKLAVKLNELITKNQPAIQAFANQLPAAFDKALEFAEKIPWDTIVDGLKMAGTWATKLFEIFTSLPPEVQGTIIALAGLNKLSGGAISGIVGELGKGLIKGVLGMTAGVVNAKAGVVNVVGAAPGAAGGAGAAGAAAGAASKGAGLLNLVSKVFLVGMAAEVASLLAPGVVEAGAGVHTALGLDKTIFGDFGRAWNDWRANADWPWGQKNAPEWAGGTGPEPAADPGPKPQTGGLSPDERGEKIAAAIAKALGTHSEATAAFGTKELTAFRTTAEGAISLFDERLKYLSGAQGSGAGTEQYLSLVQRDIDALKTIIPTASAEDAATITAQIAILEGIIEAKKFEPTAELLGALSSQKQIDSEILAATRDAGSKTSDASRSTAAATRELGGIVRDKDFSPSITVKTNVNVSTSVSVRDQVRKTRSAVATGTTYGIS